MRVGASTGDQAAGRHVALALRSQLMSRCPVNLAAVQNGSKPPMMKPMQDQNAPIALDGRCFAYVFPCAWEDYGKIGFSRDPLARIGALHHRWFEFFDLDAGMLIETETQRDARDVELALRRPLKAHRAPAPLTVQDKAGGRTEWVRGANDLLRPAVQVLAEGGHRIHPLRAWLATAMLARADGLFDWSAAVLPEEPVARDALSVRAQVLLRDALDAHVALGIDLEGRVPPHVWSWYRPA
jgi:hypothetical protein